MSNFFKFTLFPYIIPKNYAKSKQMSKFSVCKSVNFSVDSLVDNLLTTEVIHTGTLRGLIHKGEKRSGITQIIVVNTDKLSLIHRGFGGLWIKLFTN